MPTKSVGMAIRITESNRYQIPIINGGVMPSLDEGDNPEGELVYFFFPYDYDAHCEILLKSTFDKRFEFANQENVTFFVDVNEI